MVGAKSRSGRGLDIELRMFNGMRNCGAQAEKERRIRSRMLFLLKGKGMLRAVYLLLRPGAGSRDADVSEEDIVYLYLVNYLRFDHYPS